MFSSTRTRGTGEPYDQEGLVPQMSDLTMATLPGLQLSTPSEPISTQIIHDIKENTEWRFEVAFGSKIEVKVHFQPTLFGSYLYSFGTSRN